MQTMQTLTQNDFLWFVTVCGVLWTVFREVQFVKVRTQARSMQGFLRQIVVRLKTSERNSEKSFKTLHAGLERMNERVRDWVQDMRYDRLIEARSSAQGAQIYNNYSGHGDNTEIDSVDIHGGQNNVGKAEIHGNQQQQGQD